MLRSIARLVLVGQIFLGSTHLGAHPLIGKVPPPVTLEGDRGGRLNEKPWASNELLERVTVLFYVDPDFADTNDHVGKMLRANFSGNSEFQSVVIINMAATWIPNALINSKLKSKQEEFPKAIYVRDLNKVMIKEWGLADNANEVSLFDRSGKLIFNKAGALTDADIQQLKNLIEESFSKKGAADIHKK